MRKILMGAAFAASAIPFAAQADCGEVSITEMNWGSAQIVTAVAAFIMEQGYGCSVAVIPSDTVPAVASVAENNEPDIVTELWLNSTGDAYQRLEDEGRIVRLGAVLDPGGVEGWWIPRYLAEAHPELKTVQDVMANPDLVGGRFNNCPEGWGCRVVNDNLIRALDLPASGLEVFNHGSGETLATSIAAAYEAREPWFGYYWAPTALLGRYDMVKVEIGPIDEAAHARNANQGTDNPGVSDYPPATVLTSVTADFAERHPDLTEFLRAMTFEVDVMNGLLAWMDANNANAEEAAVHFLTTQPETWAEWLNDDARERLSVLVQ
jgi:glycine betaine/proline transport system substrate-binding protein